MFVFKNLKLSVIKECRWRLQTLQFTIIRIQSFWSEHMKYTQFACRAWCHCQWRGPAGCWRCRGAWVAICVRTDTPKTEGDIPWMLWARVENLGLGRNKATGAAIGARSTMASRDLQLHEWAEAALTQNWAEWKRSCFLSFCADLSVGFLYLLSRNGENKSPGLNSQVDSGYSH